MNQIDLKAALSSIPAIITAMLPQVFCPVCWPAYTGLLSTMGIGFVNYTPYVLPVTIMFLLVSLLAFAYKANKRQGYGPLIIGMAGSTLIVVGKFVLEIDPVLYLGIVVLLSGSLWNAWPSSREHNAECAICD